MYICSLFTAYEMLTMDGKMLPTPQNSDGYVPSSSLSTGKVVSALPEALREPDCRELPDVKFMPWSGGILKLPSKQQFVRTKIHLTNSPVGDPDEKGE